MIPPREDGPRPIDGRVPSHEPGGSKLRLIAELRRTPLRRGPDARDDDREHDKDLADQQLGGGQEFAPGGRKCPDPVNRTDQPTRDSDARMLGSCSFAACALSSS